MSSLFQAITRPADDFLEVRSSILNGIGGNKAPRGAHKITLVDHTVSHHSDAINAGENTGSYGSVDSDEVARKQIERQQLQQEIAEEPNTVVEMHQEGETSEYPEAIKQTNAMPPALRAPRENTSSTSLEDEDPTIGLGPTASNESAPLLPDRAGSARSSIVFGRSRKQRRKCMDFQQMLKRVFSAFCCCLPSLVDGMDDEGERYNTWNEADGPLNSTVPARIRDGYTKGYTRLKEDKMEMKPAAGKGIFSSDPNVKYDILYENQRGFFAFGNPLFSSKGLLNYDPSPWVDADYKYSPVDILSAPVPDPSWEWVWRTWYIDMTYDVDDQGWSYSLSFTCDQWHGAHVWFHSFVRRRRWIRKRRRVVADISAESEAPKGPFGIVSQGGTNSRPEGYSVLEGNTPEYFSVESSEYQARDRKHFAAKNSRKYDKGDQPLEIVTTDTGNGKTGTLGPHLRYDDYDDSLSEEEEDEDVSIKEITNIASLLRRLKKARLDRQKIEAVERFVSDGGEDVVLLASFMDQIISFLIFQESRRELLRCLLYSYQQVRSRRGKRKAGKHSEGGEDDHARLHPGHVLVDTTHLTTKEIVTRRKALHDAILVAKREIMKLDYYSDRKMSSREYARADLISSDGDPSQNTDIEVSKKAISVQDRILNEGLAEVEEEWSEDMEDEDGEVSARESSAPYSEDDASTITPRSSASRVDKGKAPEYRIPLGDINTSPDKTEGMPDNVLNRVHQEQNSTVANVQNKVINFVTSS
ncbi:hypothetical protein V1505DRAFT_97579 [Lipomyces doorenjongii]